MGYGKCFLSGGYGLVERHHIFGGALRKKSERYGLVVELSPWMHREGPKAAHRCGETREALCKYGQRKAMLEQGWDLGTWRAEFGKNWLDERELREVEGLRAEMEAGECCCTWIREEREDWYENLIMFPEDISGGMVELDYPAAEKITVDGRGFRVTIEELPF